MSIQFLNNYYRLPALCNFNYNRGNYYNLGYNNFNSIYDFSVFQTDVNNQTAKSNMSMRNIGTYSTPMYSTNCNDYANSSRQATLNSRITANNNHYGYSCYTIFPNPNPVTLISSSSAYSISSALFGLYTNDTSSAIYAASSTYTGNYSYSTIPATVNNNPKHKIAVVDYCDNSNADIDLDGDGIGDMAHGNVVANLIDTYVNNASVKTFDITENSGYSTNQRLVLSLQSILSELKADPSAYDALNMSLSSRIKYSDLSKELGVTVNNDNVDLYQDAIRNWLLTKGESSYPTTAQAVNLLEQIASYGVDIYIAAANVNDGSDDELNLYSIAKNTTTVGAKSTSGDKASFSFDNSLIDTWELGEIEVKKVKSSSGYFLGYDLNNDGIADIDSSYSSGGVNATNPFLKGTSFATPYKLSNSIA